MAEPKRMRQTGVSGEAGADLADCQAQLQRTESISRACLDLSPNAVVILDAGGSVIAVNSAALRVLGLAEPDLLRCCWFEKCLPQPEGLTVNLPAFQAYIGAVVPQADFDERVFWMGPRIVDASGQQRALEWRARRLLDAHGQLFGVIASAQDTGERGQEGFLLKALMNHVPDHVYFKDLDSRFILASQSMVSKVGFSDPAEFIGKTDFDLFAEDHARQAFEDEQAVIRTGRSLTLEERETWLDRPDTWASTIKVPLRDEAGAIVGTFGISRDITDRRQIEADVQEQIIELTILNRKLNEAQNQLLQSEKMASVGQLAAGVAHEINNPIGYIGSNLSSLKGQVDDLLTVLGTYQRAESLLVDHPDMLAQIEKAKAVADIDFLQEDIGNLISESLDGVGRVKKIVDNLKDFSRVDTSEWHLTNLEQGLESTLKIVWNEIKYKAEVRREFAGLPEVECIASQLNQVFLNLLINAAQAIDERGLLVLRTGFDDQNVWVDIEDNGKGIKPEHMKKIFEPFFTTKPVGKGTGLGLSLAYGIVEQHHGKLEVQSKVGHGTTFRVTIPRVRVIDDHAA